MQNNSTSDFIFNIQHVISHISQFMTLLSGDIISTGTPFSLGLGLISVTIFKTKTLL